MDRRSFDRRLAEIAGSQGGAFSREQALAAGFTRDMIRGRLAAGAWTVPLPRTYCPAAVRQNKITLNHAALLYAGEEALLSHLTAATLWKLKVPPSHLVWLVTPHDQTVTKQAGIAPRRTRRMPRGRTIDGLRVTPLPRTFLDLAQVLDRRPLLVAMLDAVNRGLISVERILADAEGMGGRLGLALLRDVAAELSPAFGSVLEVEAHKLFGSAGLVFERQVEILDDGQLVARVDFADRARKLVIQIDGAAWHSSAEAQQRDKEQDRRLGRLGWRVLRFTTADIRRSPRRVIAEIREEIALIDAGPATAAV
jgi:very-short-patch-repair endonuclease